MQKHLAKSSKPRNELPPPVPRPFDFGLTERHPLAPLPVVSLFLDKGARALMELIEDGQLRWAFDIRTGKANRREVRVLRQSIFELAGLYTAPKKFEGGSEPEFQLVMDLVLPPGIILSPATISGRATENTPVPKVLNPLAAATRLLFPQEPVLRGTEIGRCFACNPQHVTNLIREKCFQLVNLRRGPKATPFLTRASVVKFLRERRIT